MDFSFTEEQELLRAQARDYLKRYDTDRVAELADGEEGWDSSSWKELAELGWTGVSIPEEHGGAGLGFLEEAVIFEELGRALYPGPYFTTMALALPALEGRPDLLADVAAGETSWTLAVLGENESGYAPDLGLADKVAVATDNGIWLVEGAPRDVLPTMDSTRRLGRVTANGGDTSLLVTAADTVEVLDRIELRACAALALEAVGIAGRVLDETVEYTKTREQFGRPIGVYQAVSHPLADTYVQTELARSLAYWAAWCIAESDEHCGIAAASAKAYASETAVRACEVAIQLHGGIGFTWEHLLHRFYKRAQWIQAWDGFPSVQRALVARALLDGSGVVA